MTDQPRTGVLQHTAQVVSAHLGHNKVAAEAVPALIQAVYQALSGLGTDTEPVATARAEPAVPIRKSVYPDYIVCLEDGAKLKMLKRYIQTRHGLTPAAYRERWGLPSDYPMVAPNYTTRRSELAKAIGLGRKAAATKTVQTPSDDVSGLVPEQEPVQAGGDGEVAVTKVPARRARGSKG